MNKKIWLSVDVLFKNTVWYSSGSNLHSLDTQQRAYDIWNRANDLVKKNDSPFDLTDGITNLKRSINHRLKLIEEIYHFKKIDFPEKPKGYLELLESYSIVRPYLMKTVMEIRNHIEHNDTPPPNHQRCKELVDMVWYFLKSTDSLVSSLTTDFEFYIYDKNNNETHYGGTVYLDHTTHETMKILGWFPCESISTEKKENYIPLYVEALNRKEKWDDTKYHQDKLITDLWIIGTADTKDFNYHSFIRHLFISAR
ncbi:hypothetical protein [Enterococcus gallinarum]|uniref:Uncharacterized protein n=1 Tax=Enterococcus gallinarum TaxID=1353 RepID=A0ABD4ZRK8_ENTGA|nr:hypothetical protein [Enterococcus gallinarum]MBF0825450.1 hypothetical protein [Enterococcus faecalis]MBF0724790.1 hypothetical protein [Enterococcus gallinarum]MBF0799053.1 hypothetical protein [Enterococcus gallinarum]MBX8977466.1 hypothetical protein [Enterococcus gallinarum]MDL4874732.1 hypothetical protein [Enterococcus gallinarum]